MKINTGHIITPCLVCNEHGYSHPKPDKHPRPEKRRQTQQGFKLRHAVSSIKMSNPTTKKGKELLSWILKYA